MSTSVPGKVPPDSQATTLLLHFMYMIEKKRARNGILACMLAAACGLHFGECRADPPADAIPARLGEIEEAPQKFIPFPESEVAFPLLAQCEAIISRKGLLEFMWCRLDAKRRRTLVNAIRRGLEDSDLKPAVVNGEFRDVWVDFSFLFVQDGSQRAISFFPNNRLDSDRYGADYIGAQRVVAGPIRPRECNLAEDPRFPAITMVEVAADGAAQKAYFPNHETELNRCQDAIIKGLLSANFIPAIYRGEFVPSRYSEYWQAVYTRPSKFERQGSRGMR